jgi:hypothetical protein
VHSWEAVIAPWREQDEGIPAVAPCSADDVGAVEDRESATLASQEVADRKARLARSDYRNIEAFWITVARHLEASLSVGRVEVNAAERRS